MREATREASVAVRQQPWVTYALLLTLLASFAWARVETGQIAAELAGALGEAEAYLEAHPYLDAPPLLEEKVGADQANAGRKRFLEAQRLRGVPPIPPGIQRREQERLDGLVAESAGRLSEHPTQRWGMRIGERRPLTLLSHVLLHASWIHLLGNLFLLVVLGLFLEGTWGATLFALVAAGASVAAASVFGAAGAGAGSTWIGTSGMLAGLLGAFLVRFGESWRDATRAFVCLTGALLLVLPLVIGVQWSVVGDLGSVPVRASAFTLAAAFVFGVAAAFGIRVAQLEQLFGRPGESVARTTPGAQQLERALEHRAAGRLDQSFTLLTNRLRQDPNDLDAALVFWDVASDLGRPAAAAPALLNVIRGEVKRGANDQAVQHWFELAEAGFERGAEPALALRMAVLLASSNQRTAAAKALQQALEHAEGASGPALASRVARTASAIDPETATEAAWRALGSAELTLGERQSLENLLAEVMPRGAEAAMRRSAERARNPVRSDTSAERRPVAAARPRDTGAAVVNPEAELLEIVDVDAAPAPAGAAPEDAFAESVPEPAAQAAREPRKPEAIEIETASRSLEAIFAVPTELDAEGLFITASNGAKKRVRYDRIAAISVVAVSNLGPKPVIMVDLILNWMSLSDEPLRIIRLRGDRFDPRRVISPNAAPVDALRALIEKLLRESNAAPLPDLQSAKGLPFAAFDDLASYHRDVLMVDGENADAYAWNAGTPDA